MKAREAITIMYQGKIPDVRTFRLLVSAFVVVSIIGGYLADTEAKFDIGLTMSYRSVAVNAKT